MPPVLQFYTSLTVSWKNTIFADSQGLNQSRTLPELNTVSYIKYIIYLIHQKATTTTKSKQQKKEDNQYEEKPTKQSKNKQTKKTNTDIIPIKNKEEPTKENQK